MANSFPNPQLMPNILAGALDVLREECALATAVNKNFDNTAGEIGQVVNIATSAAQAVSAVTPAAVPPAVVDHTLGYVPITINQWNKSSFYMNVQDATFFQANVIVPVQLKEAVRALARQLNKDILATNIDCYNATGTPGTGAFATNLNPAVDVKKLLDDSQVLPGNRFLLLGHSEVAAALKLDGLQKMLNAGDANALRRGAVGELFGMATLGDLDRPTFTRGTADANYVVNNVAGVPVGATSWACDLGTGTILEGDILRFATGDTQSYVCDAGCTTTLIKIKNRGGLKVARVDEDSFTIDGTSNTAGGRNLAFDPGAFGLVMRVPPMDIEGAPTYGEHAVMTDPMTRMSMKLSYLPGYHLAQWELSVMYGVKMVDPRKCAILYSTAA